MVLINDKNTYEELKNDPTPKFQKCNKNFIKKCENLCLLSPADAFKLKIYNSNSPKICFPKLHKKNVPMRP